MTSASVLYLLKYLTTLGTATLEYLPHLANTASTVNAHYGTQLRTSWAAVFGVVLVLVGGISIRKVGTLLSRESVIQAMENFMYGGREVEADVEHED